MKYLLKQNKEDKGILCDKVTIDGYSYYVSNEKATEGFYGYINFQGGDIKKIGKYFADDWKKVIACNNPNIDISQVVDEVEVLLENYYSHRDDGDDRVFYSTQVREIINKSQEVYSFSEEDVRFMLSEAFKASQEGYQITTDEIIQLWKEQQPKVLFYE